MSHNYDGEERREPDRWKINREVSIVDLITIVAALSGIMYAFTTLDKRVTINEGSIHALVSTNKAQDELFNRVQDRSDAQFREINAKLDRLIERK